MNPVRRLLNHEWLPERESGQTLVEYGMLVTLLAMAVVLVLTVVGQDVVGLFTGLSSHLEDAAGP
jgi:Flp pilus assembly pilin Flp